VWGWWCVVVKKTRSIANMEKAIERRHIINNHLPTVLFSRCQYKKNSFHSKKKRTPILGDFFLFG
jgi:hypothetical protein